MICKLISSCCCCFNQMLSNGSFLIFMIDALLICVSIVRRQSLTLDSLSLDIESTSYTRSWNEIPLHMFHRETAVSVTLYPSPFELIKIGVPSKSLLTVPLLNIIDSESIFLSLNLHISARYNCVILNLI